MEGAQSDNALLYARELEEKRELKEQFVGKFHNISRIMDCVGCEKCKMWGKLETLGIGTVRHLFGYWCCNDNTVWILVHRCQSMSMIAFAFAHLQLVVQTACASLCSRERTFKLGIENASDGCAVADSTRCIMSMRVTLQLNNGIL